MKLVTYIRHPKSKANETHITWDVHVNISDDGYKMAHIYKEYYIDKMNWKKTLIITGTQKRSSEFAKILQWNQNNYKLVISKLFNERNFWIFTGMTKNEIITWIQEFYPEYWNNNEFSSLMDQKIGIPWWFETNYDTQNRIYTVVSKTIQDYPEYDNIICIASTWMIRNILALVLWKTALEIDSILPDNKIPNLSMTTMQYDEQKWLFLPPSQIAYISEELQELFDDLRISL